MAQNLGKNKYSRMDDEFAQLRCYLFMFETSSCNLRNNSRSRSQRLPRVEEDGI